MLYLYPGYDSITWWRHQRIKEYDTSPLLVKFIIILNMCLSPKFIKLQIQCKSNAAPHHYCSERPVAVAESVRASASCVEGRGFESRLSQTDGLPNLYLSLPNMALGILRIRARTSYYRLVQYWNNVTEWDIRSWNQWPGFPVWQQYKRTVSSWY